MKAIRPSSTCVRQIVSGTSSTCRAAFLSIPNQPHRQERRTFLNGSFTQNQTLTASRTLRYPSSVVYSVISDVGSYSQFLPYCQGSIVTKTSQPAKDGKTYPEEAKLLIGFNNDISEEFTSRVYCVPERVVEAVSGSTESTLSGEDIAHHNPRPSTQDDASRKNTTMARLLTRWTLRPYHYKPPPVSAIHPETSHKNVAESGTVPSQEKTEVNLAIEFQFSNPLYAALSSAAAPKVAEKMIEAFEKRVKAIVEGPASVRADGKRMEGVLSKK